MNKKILGLILVFVILNVTIGCSGAPPQSTTDSQSISNSPIKEVIPLNATEAEEYYNTGVSLYDQKKYDEAIIKFEQVIKFNPNHEESKKYLIFALQNKGAELFDQGMDLDALIYFDKAIAIDPNNSVSLSMKGFVLSKQEKYSEAIIYYDEALAIDPNNKAIWYYKGDALLYSGGKYSEAITCFDKALDLDSNYGSAWNDKGVALYKLGRYSEALTCYEKALVINPNNSIARENKEIVLEEIKENQKNSWIQPGMYRVGIDISPGEYFIASEIYWEYLYGNDSGGSYGYYEVNSDSSGGINSIVANDNFLSNRYVTVSKGQYFEVKKARFIPVDKAPFFEPVNGMYIEGMYKVGRDIPPGEYRVVKYDSADMAYVEVAKDSKGTLYSIISNDNFENNKFVTVTNGQYLTLVRCYIKK